VLDSNGRSVSFLRNLVEVTMNLKALHNFTVNGIELDVGNQSQHLGSLLTTWISNGNVEIGEISDGSVTQNEMPSSSVDTNPRNDSRTINLSSASEQVPVGLGIIGVLLMSTFLLSLVYI
jgi:hypothetical protein